MSKFAGLPGIDTSLRDVYETSDTEIVNPQPPLPPPNEDIITESIDARGALFQNLDLGFGGNGARLFGETETTPKLGLETRQQRLLRIARELEELEQEEDDTEEIERLKQMVEALKQPLRYSEHYQELVALFKHVSVDHPSNEMGSSSVQTPSPIPSLGLSSVEKRVASLESRVGDAPVLTVVADLDRKINIIYNPEYELGKVQDKLKVLSEDYEKLIAKQKVFELEEPKTPHPVQVEQLFNRLPQFDAVNEQVPGIIDRLQTLASVHAEVVNCVDANQRLDQVLALIEAYMKKWDAHLDDVAEQLTASEEAFAENKRKLLEELKK